MIKNFVKAGTNELRLKFLLLANKYFSCCCSTESISQQVVDVLVNAVTTLAALCRGDRSGAGNIQDRIMNCGAAASLVRFLEAKDDALQTATADAIAAICEKNEPIQVRSLTSAQITFCLELNLQVSTTDCFTEKATLLSCKMFVYHR